MDKELIREEVIMKKERVYGKYNLNSETVEKCIIEYANGDKIISIHHFISEMHKPHYFHSDTFYIYANGDIEFWH